MTPLTGLTQIHLLQLDKNKVASLAPLVKWAKADADGAKRFAPYLRLYVAGNPLDAESKDKSLPAETGGEPAGKSLAGSALNNGSESRNGSAMTTPVPRRKLRREIGMGRCGGVNGLRWSTVEEPCSSGVCSSSWCMAGCVAVN